MKRQSYSLGVLGAAVAMMSGRVASAQAQTPVDVVLRQVTTTGFLHPLRNPAFTPLDQKLVLWWRTPTPLEDKERAKGTPWKHATLKDGTFIPDKSLLHIQYGFPLSSVFEPIPGKQAIAVGMTLNAFFRDSYDVGLREITWEGDAQEPAFKMSPGFISTLPYAIEGFPPPPAEWKNNRITGDYPALIRDQFGSPQLYISPTKKRWYLTGTGSHETYKTVTVRAFPTPISTMTKQEIGMWFTWSEDEGKTWKKRPMIGPGNAPHLVENKNGELLLFYSATRYNNMAREWPDDARIYEGRPQPWPSTGPLAVMVSKDGGESWSQPQTLVADDLVINSTAAVDKDGKVWLVYVKSHPARAEANKTSLWLTSSLDGGTTWQPPQQITNGKFLDREPDLAFDGDKLLVAFSRSGQAINTNIWTAEIPTK